MKKILLVSLLVLSAVFIWFLFFKEFDYQFRMKSKYGPGVAFDEISEWKKFDGPNSDDNINIIKSEPFSGLTQEVYIGEKPLLEFEWEFEKENDSVTQLTLNVKSKTNQLKNRLAIVNPFHTSELVDTLENKLIRFKKRLNTVQETYAITISDSLVETPAIDCLCHSSSNIEITKKAGEMVRTISYLEDYINNNDLQLNGVPFVKVTNWDLEKKRINFDFCFPVKIDPSHQISSNILHFRKIPEFKALKAVFNGNYRVSHLAWYDLKYEAKERGYKTSGLPLELFYDNPNMGTPSINWKAEIFMPVKD